MINLRKCGECGSLIDIETCPVCYERKLRKKKKKEKQRRLEL